MTFSPTAQSNRTTPPGGSYKRVRAPRGTALICRGWQQEAALRMLMNSLDDEVAKHPEDLVVYGSDAKPVADWDGYHAILRSLRSLKDDETLLIQSGKPAGVVKTDAEAPRILIVNSDVVSPLSEGNKLPESEELGLVLFGQDAARSWTYIGSQQALHTAFETFAAVGKAHFGGDLSGRLIVSGGMGVAGGVQPLAATLLGAAFLGIDADSEKITRRIRAGYCDFCVSSLDEALRILKNAVRQRQPVSVGLAGNCAEIIPELSSRGVVPDILSDLTGVCDLLNGYFPAGLTLKEAGALRRANPEDYLQRACQSLARHAGGMLELQKLGAVTFDFGNNLRRIAAERAGVQDIVSLPGFVSTYLRPEFSEGRAPLRWVALSGERRNIQHADNLLLELFPDDEMLARWIRLARKYVTFQGLPGRVAWLSSEQGARFAERLNALVAKGELIAPVVIARDQVDCGLGVSPFLDSQGMKDVSDLVINHRALDSLLSVASGASWVSLHGVRTNGSDYFCRTTQAAIADGTPESGRRLQRILKSGSSFRLIRRAGSDNERAQDLAGPTP